MRNLFFVFLLGMGLIGISGCGEDCESCNTTADFTISEGNLNFGEHNVWLEEDTVGTNKDVKFEAVCDDMTRYEWTVGTDQRVFTEPSFTLYFGVTGTIDIKLKVYKDEDPNCPDNVVRVDSVVKKLTIVSNSIRYYLGKFRGYNEDNPNHLFDIELLYDSTWLRHEIRNLPEGCHLEDSRFAPATFYPFRTRFYMDMNRNQPSCDRPKGWGYIDDSRNKIIIEYYLKDFDNQVLVPHKFIGTRL